MGRPLGLAEALFGRRGLVHARCIEGEDQGLAGADIGFGADLAAHGLDDLAAQRDAEGGLQPEQGLDLADVQGALTHHPVAAATHAAFHMGGFAVDDGLQGRLDRAAAHAGQGLGDEGVEHLLHPRRVHQHQGVGIAVIGDQQGDAAVARAGFPAGLHLVGQVGRAGRLGRKAQPVDRRVLQVVGRGQDLADGPGGFHHPGDASLRVRAHRLTGQAFGERQHAFHLLMDLARHALVEELGQGHKRLGPGRTYAHHAPKRLRRR